MNVIFVLWHYTIPHVFCISSLQTSCFTSINQSINQFLAECFFLARPSECHKLARVNAVMQKKKLPMRTSIDSVFRDMGTLSFSEQVSQQRRGIVSPGAAPSNSLACPLSVPQPSRIKLVWHYSTTENKAEPNPTSTRKTFISHYTTTHLD